MAVEIRGVCEDTKGMGQCSVACRVNMMKKFVVQQEFIGVLSIYGLHKNTLCAGGSSVAVSSTSKRTLLACVVQTSSGNQNIS